MEKGELLFNLRQVLLYHKELGIEYHDSGELQKFFSVKAVSASKERPELNQSQLHDTLSADANRQSVSNQAVEKPIEIITNGQLIKEEELCSGCQLKAKKLDFIIGKGGENIKLMVVGDWVTTSARGESKNTVFGAEQDLMLARMFTKMQLSEENVFITNVIKCALPDDIKPEKHDISRCVKYLYYQIEKIRPDVICVMGTSAARTLLKKNVSLSQLRGKFYQIEISKELSIPVLATYHPSYLLKNKEMRWPAWEDLQKVAKRLGISIEQSR